MNNNNQTTRYQISFDYNYYDDISIVLKKTVIIQTTFEKNCIITFEVSNDEASGVLSRILIITYKQVSIRKITFDEELQEVGTDKPLGSKSAIDEN